MLYIIDILFLNRVHNRTGLLEVYYMTFSWHNYCASYFTNPSPAGTLGIAGGGVVLIEHKKVEKGTASWKKGGAFWDLVHPKCELHKSFIYKKTICKNPSKFCIVKINVSQFWIFEIIRNISKNQQMDSKFPGDWDVRKPQKIVWLRAVSANFVFSKIYFSDSAQC